jgi:2-keto-3-deoxy-L-rhamnonate aldolase RhmA
LTVETLPKNRIRSAVRSGRAAVGLYVTQPAPTLIDIAAAAKLDFVRIDACHGALGPETIDSLIRAAYANSITPAIRTLPEALTMALERGAMAITIPNVHSEAAARMAVDLSRYPPRGQREISRPPRSLAASADEYFLWADKELVVSLQIESEAGLAAVESIARVDGVDMLQSGRQDLALALGVPGNTSHPKVLAAEERIVETAWKAGKWASLHFPPGPDAQEMAARWLARGVECVTIGSDLQVLLHAIRNRLSEFATLPPANPQAKDGMS